ncbi:MAG: hypothetical protein QOC62_6572 [Mycobacterium sp.]|nr:hypothetical protein [Mycobacterium sp.]
MKLKNVLATATIASALGLGALGVGGAGVASAYPGTPIPTDQGQCGRDFNCQPGPGGPRGPEWNAGPSQGPRNDDWNRGDGNWNRGDGNWNNRGDGNWNNGDQDWSVGSVNWWRGRPGKWWRDGDLPPWGFWGAPPAFQWSGPPPWVDPHPINYWGYNATPVWDDNFHGWGIWLFGAWVPIVGIGT